MELFQVSWPCYLSSVLRGQMIKHLKFQSQVFDSDALGRRNFAYMGGNLLTVQSMEMMSYLVSQDALEVMRVTESLTY